MKYQFIKTSNDGAIHLLVINRPENTNKLNVPCMEELCQALRLAESDQNCKVVILTAFGEFFCNGGELGDFRIKSPLEIRQFGAAFIKLHQTIGSLAKPVIAMVQGHAHGGGFSLVEACDLAVAAEEATFAVPEINSGLAPMMALTGVTRVVSKKRLMELSILGETISAQRALEIGLINRVCGIAELDSVTMEMANRLIIKNPTAISLCKQLYQQIDGLNYQRQLENGLNMLVSLLKSEDAAESLSAKEENRQPVWQGR